MQISLVDVVGISVYFLIAVIIYKKAWFYSFYSFIKFLIIAVLSFSAGLFLSSKNPVDLPITKLEQSLIIQLILFIFMWKFISFKKGFFFINRKTLDVDRFFFVYKIDKYIAVAPALIASFFITFFLFTTLVSASTGSPFLQKEIEESKIVKNFAYKIYFAPTTINSLKIFEGTVFKINPTENRNGFSVSKIGQSVINSFTKSIKKSFGTITAMFPPPKNSTSSNPTPTSSQTQPADAAAPPNQNPVNIPVLPTLFIPNPTTFTQNPTQPPSNTVSTPTPQPYLPDPTPTSTPYTPPPATTNISQVEQDIFRLTNEARAANGVAPLVWSDQIASVARNHSQDMNNRNFFNHINPDGRDPFQRLNSGGVSFATAGENIAGGPTADIMVNNWMNSSGHRANILNPAFHKIGIGVTQNSGYGLLATQNFTN